jgi:hypothetical protein
MSDNLLRKNAVCYEEIITLFAQVKTELEKEKAWSACVKLLVKNYGWLCRDAWLIRRFPAPAEDKQLFEETVKSAFFEAILFLVTKVLNHPEKFDLKADVGAYLRIVLRNMAANAIRKVFRIITNDVALAKNKQEAENENEDEPFNNSSYQTEKTRILIISGGISLIAGGQSESDFQEFPTEGYAEVKLETYRNKVLQRLHPSNPPLCKETIRYRCLDVFNGQDLFILLEYAIDRHLVSLSTNLTVQWSLPELNAELQKRGGTSYSAVQGLSNAIHRVTEKFLELSVRAKNTCELAPGKPCGCSLKNKGL